jgi:hypothetical protein
MPFPSTKVIHDRWSEHHQPVARGGMTCKVRVSIAGDGPGSFDSVSGYTTPPARVTKYEGPARIQAVFRPAEADVGEQDVTVRRYLVAIDATAADIPYAAMVEVLEARNDAELLNRRFYVEEATVGSERFQRDLICTETFATASTEVES